MKVRLPSDGMTPAQLRQQSGEVVEYSLGKPMTYQQLLALPPDLRKKYLEKLVAEFKANQRALADMLGVNRQTLCRRCREWGVNFPQGAAAIMTPWEKAQFYSWARGIKDELPAEAALHIAAPVVADQTTKAPAPAATLTAGHMVFHGSAGAAMRQVYDMLGEMPCTITIVWEVEEAADNVPL